MPTPYRPDPHFLCPPGEHTEDCVLCGGTFDKSDTEGGYRTPVVCHPCLNQAVEDLTTL